MQRAKAFFFVCLGILALALAYHFGANSARASVGGEIVGWSLSGGYMQVMTSEGDFYLRSADGFDTYGPVQFAYNFWTGDTPTSVQRETWGSVKQRYLSPDAARPDRGQASRPRR